MSPASLGEFELIIVLENIDDNDIPLNSDLVLWNRRLRSRFVDFVKIILILPMFVLTILNEQSLEDMFKEYSSVTQSFHRDILLHQENMEQHFKDINLNLRNIETLTSKMNDTLNRLFEEEFPVLLSCDKKETLNDVTLMSVEATEHAMNEHFAIDGLTPCIYEYLSDHEESEGKLEVSQSKPEIVMAQTHEEEAEKEIEVTLTRPEVLQQESKEDQSFVLVNPPTFPYIFEDFYDGPNNYKLGPTRPKPT
ncbi:hypothetical protein Sjap_001677 [Stephania japonica]|uniref:Uncharacterized protein n=1 Tax=Stephania japonica TaxID=461633 RepID=A0AAP0KKE2_9MAGN